MARTGLIAGTCYLKVNGVQHEAKGEFTYGGFAGKRTEVVGSGGLHGFSEEDQAPYIEGAITVGPDVDAKAFCAALDATVTLELKNGKVVTLSDAGYTGDCAVKTRESEMAVKFVGKNMDIN